MSLDSLMETHYRRTFLSLHTKNIIQPLYTMVHNFGKIAQPQEILDNSISCRYLLHDCRRDICCVIEIFQFAGLTV